MEKGDHYSKHQVFRNIQQDYGCCVGSGHPHLALFQPFNERAPQRHREVEVSPQNLQRKLLTVSFAPRVNDGYIHININQGKNKYMTLRIMGSQNWWFGDPRTLLYRVQPVDRRVHRFLGDIYIYTDIYIYRHIRSYKCIYINACYLCRLQLIQGLGILKRSFPRSQYSVRAKLASYRNTDGRICKQKSPPKKKTNSSYMP